MPQLPAGAWHAHWIALSGDPREDLGVFAFRCPLDLETVPSELKVRVSADNRYKLFVNGHFVGFGPQRGDVLHWFYETYDLAPLLKPGKNWVAALVWNFGRWAPMAQHTARTGFVLEPLDTRHSTLATPGNWQAARLKNWSFDMMHSEDMNFYIDIGPGEIMDFRGAPWGWRTGEDAKGLADWRKPHHICRAEDRGTMGGMTPWSLVPRSIPAMLYEGRAAAPVIRRGFSGDSDKSDFSDKSVLPEGFPLELGRKYLFDYGELLTAYPRLALSGPAGTVVVLSYSEGMWQEKGGKGNRDEVAGKKMSGYQDKIVLDGESRTIEPLWWRTYRYLMIESFHPSPLREGSTYPSSLREAEGGGAGEGGSSQAPTPLPSSSGAGGGGCVLHHLSAIETGYPLRVESSFSADNPDVEPIWDVSVRTARRCAGETYFDCPYYEQLQYVGDTRIQALIGCYLGRDRALTRNAVETLGWSLMENGLTQSRYPSRQPQIIPPFSLWWVMMLWDQLLYDSCPPCAEERSREADQVLEWFARTLASDEAHALFWQFGDWVPNWPWGVPPSDAIAPIHLLTYQLASMVSDWHTASQGDGAGIKKELWRSLGQLELERTTGLIQRDADPKAGYSEHAEALWRLIQLTGGKEPDPWPTQALGRASAAKCTYYFSYYKHLAMFGRGDVDRSNRSYRTYEEGKEPQTFDYMTELAPWKEQIENGLTTFAENPEPTRSDCHAWSAHPILGFFQIVAGVTSIIPGWKKARIDPRPGELKRFEANIAHPDGILSVKFEGGKLEVDSPVPFEMRWKGRQEDLKAGKHKIG